MNLKKNMDSNEKKFEVEFTEECIDDMSSIYEYISFNLRNNRSAIKLIERLLSKIIALDKSPHIYPKIGKQDRLKRDYRKIIVGNYIALYTIDYNRKKVFISHVIYNKKDYLN